MVSADRILIQPEREPINCVRENHGDISKEPERPETWGPFFGGNVAGVDGSVRSAALIHLAI
jgi:hypothetical protein